MSDTGFQRASSLLRRHTQDTTRPGEFTLLGRDWDLMDGVFSPTYTPVTDLFTSWLPFPDGGSFLEIGSGAGVTAVVAAQSGCARVTALDISPAAVENTRRNVVRHKVEDRVRVLESDLFDALPPEDRYDLVYWNSNFAEPPADFVNETDLHHAFFDPGYDAHRRFLKEAPGRLTPEGSLLLGFSSIGNVALLRRLAADAGLEPSMLRSEQRQLDRTVIEFQLWRLAAA
ncbi:methyltransferase [Streptomyces griseus]|uniref:methyltransferase n=1 Tax=Streptomyces griseus TaxID=1911 RepID=UPI0008400F6E|nr:methyltransferase [Streptomyces griseus]